jgi:hypothetical protein
MILYLLKLTIIHDFTISNQTFVINTLSLNLFLHPQHFTLKYCSFNILFPKVVSNITLVRKDM